MKYHSQQVLLLDLITSKFSSIRTLFAKYPLFITPPISFVFQVATSEEFRAHIHQYFAYLSYFFIRVTCLPQKHLRGRITLNYKIRQYFCFIWRLKSSHSKSKRIWIL